jgi:hypothetical protein
VTGPEDPLEATGARSGSAGGIGGEITGATLEGVGATPPVGGIGAPAGMGAVRDTKAVLAGVAGGAGKAADRARDLGHRLADDRDRLIIALGGGPPPELRETSSLNREATVALDAAAVALREAAAALRGFNRRLG